MVARWIWGKKVYGRMVKNSFLSQKLQNGVGNPAYNFRRLIWFERHIAPLQRKSLRIFPLSRAKSRRQSLEIAIFKFAWPHSRHQPAMKLGLPGCSRAGGEGFGGRDAAGQCIGEVNSEWRMNRWPGPRWPMAKRGCAKRLTACCLFPSSAVHTSKGRQKGKEIYYCLRNQPLRPSKSQPCRVASGDFCQFVVTHCR